MKITKSRLKEIIKEELANLNEVGFKMYGKNQTPASGLSLKRSPTEIARALTVSQKKYLKSWITFYDSEASQGQFDELQDVNDMSYKEIEMAKVLNLMHLLKYSKFGVNNEEWYEGHKGWYELTNLGRKVLHALCGF